MKFLLKIFRIWYIILFGKEEYCGGEDVLENNNIRISASALAVGMTVARTIGSKQGTVLIPEGSVLTDTMIQVVKRNEVKTVLVFADDRFDMVEVEDEDENNARKKFGTQKKTATLEDEMEAFRAEMMPLLEESRNISIGRTGKEFMDFKNEFEQKSQQVKKYFEDLAKGVEIDFSAVSATSMEVFSKFGKKNNLMLYLHALNQANEYVYAHSLRVSLLAALFGRWLALPESDVEGLALAGMLHDIGMSQIKPEVLDKEDEDLTLNEQRMIRQHTIVGAQMLLKHKLPAEVKGAVANHHERADGSGYPNKKKDDQLNSYAKILSIVDAFDNLCNHKDPTKSLTPFQSIKFFEASLEIFSPKYLMVFLNNIAYGYRNARVELSDERIAKIIFINSRDITRPIVELEDETLLDLSEKHCKIRIKKIL